MAGIVTKDFAVLARFVREVSMIEQVVPPDVTDGGTLRSLTAAGSEPPPPPTSSRRHVLNDSGRYSIIHPRTRSRAAT